MKFIYHLECVLIWISLLAIAAHSASASTYRGVLAPAILFGFIFLTWGFFLWRKMKKWEERELHQRALPWFEAIFYSFIAGVATKVAFEEYLGASEPHTYVILLIYFGTPIVGILGVALNLRRTVIRPNQSGDGQ